MSASGRSLPVARVVGGAVIGAIVAIVAALVLREVADGLSDGGGRLLAFALVGAIIGGLGALLITAERRDGANPRQGRKRKM